MNRKFELLKNGEKGRRLKVERKSMKWIRYSLEVPASKVDIVTAVLTELPYIQGIEVEDSSLTEEECKALFVDILPEGWNQRQSVIPIHFYLSEDMTDKAEEIAGLLRPFLGEEIVFVQTVTEEEDWANQWKRYYHSFAIGDKIWIYPIWEEKNPAFPIQIGLDPGMAFGSGTHETTELCVTALEKYLQKEDRVMDVGTGSGILAIAAAKLGAREVLAVDLDENAVKVAKENIQFNQVENMVQVEVGNLAEGATGTYDVVVANILAEVICILAKEVKRFLKPKGMFLTSGIIAEKTEMVKKALAEQGLTVVEVMEKGEWRMVAAHA